MLREGTASRAENYYKDAATQKGAKASVSRGDNSQKNISTTNRKQPNCRDH